MKSAHALLLLSSALLACCAQPAPRPVATTQAINSGGICRIGPNDGPLMTERGIGGTGAPAGTQTADRGIGGTGIKPSTAEQDADRTGIVGVVTGFASICLDGLEVGFDSTATVDIDGSAATADQLRAGQLVLVNATAVVKALTPGAATLAATTDVTGTPTASATSRASLRARTISVRHEVSGPIEAVDAASGVMLVAGQLVAVRHAGGVSRPSLGDWISVSGLREADGTIAASRLDSAPVGTLMVRGQVSRQDGTLSVGRLVLVGPKAAGATPGPFITLVGRYRAGAVEVTSMAPDRLRSDPAGYFGPTVNNLVLQGFMRVDHGMVWLDNGQGIPSGPDVRAVGGAYRDAIVSLRRGPDGGLTATGLRYADDRDLPAGARPGTETARGAGVAAPRVIPARGGDDGAAWDSAPEPPPILPAMPAPTVSAPAPQSPITTAPVSPPAPALPVVLPPVTTQPVAALPGITPPPPGAPTMPGNDLAAVGTIPSRNAKRLAGPGPTGDHAAVAGNARTGPDNRSEALPAGAHTASASDRRVKLPTVFTAASTVAPAAPAATGTPEATPLATGLPPHQR